MIQMTKHQAQAVGDSLKPCPFCGQRLDVSIRGAGEHAANPKARCTTGDCWGSKLPTLPLDVPEFVAAWNTRAPAPGQVYADDIQWTAAELAEMDSRRAPLQFNTLPGIQN